MQMPSISLPTGPYDWHENTFPREIFEKRLAVLRSNMEKRGHTHVIVYGNSFDHEALLWFTNFTPKLGSALLLVGRTEGPKLLFSGSPGMRQSAERMTWVSDVVALRGLAKDVTTWIEPARDLHMGLICGSAILEDDFNEIQRAAGGKLTNLDHIPDEDAVIEGVRRSSLLLQKIADFLFATARPGSSTRALVLDAEKLAYESGAQDVRIRIARGSWGQPVTLPDEFSILPEATPVALAVRYHGWWAYGDFLIAGTAPKEAQIVGRLLENGGELLSYANRVAFPQPQKLAEGLVQTVVEKRCRWSGLCVVRGGHRDWLFRPPGVSSASQYFD